MTQPNVADTYLVLTPRQETPIRVAGGNISNPAPLTADPQEKTRLLVVFDTFCDQRKVKTAPKANYRIGGVK